MKSFILFCSIILCLSVTNSPEINLDHSFASVGKISVMFKDGLGNYNFTYGSVFPISTKKHGEGWISYFITAKHVVETPGTEEQFKIELFENLNTTITREFLKVELVKSWEDLDTALLRVNHKEFLQPLPVSKFLISKKQENWTVSCPFGIPPIHIKAIPIRPAENNTYLINSVCCPGSSGGAVINENGEVVGLIHAILYHASGFSEQFVHNIVFIKPSCLWKSLVEKAIKSDL